MPPYVWSVMDHEEDIPTEQQAPQEETRISNPNENKERSPSTESPPQEGAKTPGRLETFAFPRSARLLHRVDYQRVYREGSRVGAQYFVFFWLTNSIDGCRLGITASRKVGNAVVRARCRRYTRELYRLNRQELWDLSVDVVVNVKRSCKDATWEALKRDFLYGLTKLRLVEKKRNVGSG